MNNLIVYCEIEDGIIADVSLELLTTCLLYTSPSPRD